MSTPESNLPAPPSPRLWDRVLQALRTALLLLLTAGLAAGGTYYAMDWRLRQSEVETAAALAAMQESNAALQQSLGQSQSELDAKLVRIEQAAREAKLLLEQDGQTVGLDQRLKEIDLLRLELKQARDEMASKLTAMERSVVDQIAQQGQETAQALAVEMRYKSLLIRAQGEVLLAQIYWSEGNRGLARDELAIAYRSLTRAQEEAPEKGREAIKPVLALAEQARSALILEQSGARDSMNLLWHRVSELLAP